MARMPKGSKPRQYLTTTIQLTQAIIDALDALALARECSRSTIVRQFITEGLSHTHQPKKDRA